MSAELPRPERLQARLRSIVYWPAHRDAPKDLFSVSPPDVVILDLEDGVPRERMSDARARLVHTYHDLRMLGLYVVVRVNGIESPEFFDDIAQLLLLPDDLTILLPKPISADALNSLAGQRRSLWCMGEELRVTDHFSDFRRQVPSLSTVVIGVKDLSHELGVPLDLDSPEIRKAANEIRRACRLNDLAVIDGIVFGAADAVARRCARAATDGFDGVTLARVEDVSAANWAFDKMYY
jgi:citrate lyase beta subunit